MTSTPLTDLRDENNSDWHRWAERNPDAYVEHSKARQRRYQSATAGGARSGEPWAEWEFQALMAERPLIEIALELGRTYAACAQARRRRLKMLGLHRPRIKTEQDPYDGSVVSLRPERRNE